MEAGKNSDVNRRSLGKFNKDKKSHRGDTFSELPGKFLEDESNSAEYGQSGTYT
jgi:hypothetical protein